MKSNAENDPVVEPGKPAAIVGIGASAGGLEAIEALFEHAPAGYVVLDESGIIRQTNATWRAMLKQEEDDFRGHAICPGHHLRRCPKQTVAPRILDLNMTVQGMLSMLGRLIGEDIRLTWLPGSDLWPVRMDPSQIDQILANLCVNARDAIADVGTIAIETRNMVLDTDYCAHNPECVPGEYLLLSVSDDGCGMEKNVLARLFEPFFTTKEVGKGTGLGLATVYGIVRQNKGFVNVYSEPGRGTSFRIYLPRHIGDEDQTRPVVQGSPIQTGHETIMLVEDEPMLVEIGTSMLERLGYKVLAAGTPEEAVRMADLHAGEIHLLMTDVILPGMNGMELSERLLHVYPDLKCLFMSGYTADVIAHHGVLDPAVHFIQKPFTFQALSAKLREVLGLASGDR